MEEEGLAVCEGGACRIYLGDANLDLRDWTERLHRMNYRRDVIRGRISAMRKSEGVPVITERT